MKKSIFTIALMASLLAGASDTDSYLYWMVNVDEGTWTYPYKVQVRGMTGADGDQGSLLSLYYGDGTLAESDGGKSIGMDFLKNYENIPGAGFYALLSTPGAYTSYVIELWSGSNDLVGSRTFADVEIASYIARSGISAPLAGPLMVPMALQVPEPTSGLLLLLGVAGLALRRRKPVVA